MNPALWISKTGLDAQQMRMSVISNNLANVSTHGYKKERANFEDLFYQNLKTAGGQTSASTTSPGNVHLGTGVRVVSTDKQHSQGNIIQTENSLDVAINGRGFFQVSMPDGTTSYTRDGAFKVDGQGNVVTSHGYQVLPGLNVPQGTTSINIGDDGTMTAQVAGTTAPTQIGQITLVDFMNPVGLNAIGANLFEETVASGTPTEVAPGQQGVGTLRQGFLETSNVNIAEEMINMIETQRAYEINSKSISTTDKMLQYLNNNV